MKNIENWYTNYFTSACVMYLHGQFPTLAYCICPYAQFATSYSSIVNLMNCCCGRLFQVKTVFNLIVSDIFDIRVHAYMLKKGFSSTNNRVNCLRSVSKQFVSDQNLLHHRSNHK